MNEYKKIFRIFLAGEEDKECKWLSQMSRDGYHLQNVSFATYYTFKKDIPKDYIYMIDLKENNYDNDEVDYVAIYEESGLEYINKSNNFYYFRCDKNDRNIELIKNENGRYLATLKSQQWILIFAALMNLLIVILNSYTFTKTNTPLNWTLGFNLGAGLICLLAYIKILRKKKSLIGEGVSTPYKASLKDWTAFWVILIVFLFLIGSYTITILLEL